jgi:hypothetical protein
MNPTKQLVALLVVLQLVSAAYLWGETAVGTLSAAGFAIFLAVDLLSFTLVAYVYTHERWGEAINRVWILLGAVGLTVLLISSLYLS